MLKKSGEAGELLKSPKAKIHKNLLGKEVEKKPTLRAI